MKSTPIIVLLGCSLALGLSPLEGDRVIHEGFCPVNNRNWSTDFILSPGERPLGLFLNVEGIEEFVVELNGARAAQVLPGEARRTRVRTVDLSGCAGLLKPGQNRVSVLPAVDAPGFWCRFWVSSHAWLLGSFHSHTVYSDGTKSVHDLLKTAAADGARFCAVTDHDNLAQCRDTAFRATDGLQPLHGLEWTTDSGHANVLGLAGGTYIKHASVVQMIDDASYRGGLVQVNHPMLRTVEWQRYPSWDPGLDAIEIFNQFNWARATPGGDNGDAAAVAWWQRLLADGHSIAAVGNSDYHGIFPHERTLQPCTRVFVPATHPDTILKYLKLGRAMTCDRPDETRVYIYADVGADGRWEAIMGDHVRSATVSPFIRFRLEVENADRASVVTLWNRAGEFYRHSLQDGGDHEYEWDLAASTPVADFVRAELRTPRSDGPEPYFEVCTNPIYINYAGYELGPLRLAVEPVRWPDSLRVGREDTLRFRLTNVAGYSPYRFGLEVACDTQHAVISGWQRSGPGVGGVKYRRDAGRYEAVEWQGGYASQIRLAEGIAFEYWLTVRPRRRGTTTLLMRAWGSDRLFEIAREPDSGAVGPDGLSFGLVRIAAAPALDGRKPLDIRREETSRAPGAISRHRIAIPVTVAPGRTGLTLLICDVTGRTVAAVRVERLPPGPGCVDWDLRDGSGARVPPGLYFALPVGSTQPAVRLLVVD